MPFVGGRSSGCLPRLNIALTTEVCRCIAVDDSAGCGESGLARANCNGRSTIYTSARVLALLALAAPILNGCFLPRATEVPIPSRFYASADTSKDYLVVLLPGRGDDLGAYERNGFLDVLAQSTRPLDAVAVDAHLGYYIDKSVGDRVYEDILVPYQAKGYRKFLLVGISLGGVGALKIRHDFPELIDGTVLIAPYLGREDTVAAVGSADDIHAWRQALVEPPTLDEEIWTWVDALYDAESRTIPCTILAYGLQDSFAESGKVFGEMLPDSRIFTAGGGHKWIVWRPLWSNITTSHSWEQLSCAGR